MIEMKTKIEKDKLLVKLKDNRDNHRSMYLEARAGYIQKAKEKIIEKLNSLEEGKVERLIFGLTVPEDKTSIYDQVIGMLEWTEEKVISLTAEEFRNFVLDEWDWLGSWITANQGYSKNARDYGKMKGIL